MTPDEADRHAEMAAAYVHVPFCSKVCPYCDFAVAAGKDHLVDRYIDAVVAEIRRSARWRPLQAIYFGGGTPSHVDPALLGMVLDTLDDRHGIASGAEISLEANPEDFTMERAGALRGIGFNRVSFGAQSFDGSVLVELGRRHQRTHIAQSVEAARDAGFDNLSLDLIYGSPIESDDSWEESVGAARTLRPDHMSCYALTVERGTPLGRAVAAGAPAPDPDVQADRWELAHAHLGESGYTRYEVSNWSLPHRQCRYNLVVWAQGQYEAYGNGAHGFRDGIRFRNHRGLEAYLNHVEDGRSPRAGEEIIGGWDAEIDRLFVGLRRAVGVAHGPGTQALLESEEGQDLLDKGVIEVDATRVRVARPLLTDAVDRIVLSLSPPIVTLQKHA